MSGAPRAPAPRREGDLRMALASDQRLIAEAVAAALSSRGLAVDILAWPTMSREDPVGRQVAAVEPDVALLLYDVDMSLRMALAASVVRSWPGPWVVLTGAPPGPAWGGLLAAGAAAVGPSDLGLARLEELVRRVTAGAEPDPAAMGYAEAWRAVQERHDHLQDRLDSLAPRERDVLELARRGVRVVDIARRWGVAEATVRTQVRAVLRKLDVRSQLAAVALLRTVDEAVDEGADEAAGSSVDP